jgi:hypothetical protein
MSDPKLPPLPRQHDIREEDDSVHHPDGPDLPPDTPEWRAHLVQVEARSRDTSTPYGAFIADLEKGFGSTLPD